MMATGDTLFVYGTLQDERVIKAVTGKVFPARAALLHGFRREGMQGVRYPGMVADASAMVDGLLLEQVDQEAMAALDRFEGEQYERLDLTVEVNGEAVATTAYVLADAFRHLLDGRPWLLEDFRRDGIAQFMATYPNF